MAKNRETDRVYVGLSQPFRLDELRPNRPLRQFLKGRVEAFDVPDLKRDIVFRGPFDQIIGLGDRPADRFLDQHGNAMIQEAGSDRVMVDGRRDDTDGVHFVQKGFVRVVGMRIQAASDGAGLKGVRVHDPDQFDIDKASGMKPETSLASMLEAGGYAGDRKNEIARRQAEGMELVGQSPLGLLTTSVEPHSVHLMRT